MIIVFIILAVITIWGIRFSSFNEGYISLESTNAIKGVFAVIILFSHMNGYIVLQDRIYDTLFESILRHLGQLMVAPYLFFSGYGILESLKRKPKYSSTFPKNRIFKTLVHFDIAVAFYLLMSLIIGFSHTPSDYIWCWIGWTSIGNSNWFVFVILLLYLLSYFSIIVAERFCMNEKSRSYVTVCLTSVLSIVAWLFLYYSDKGSWWYDTIITFPLGMWFSYYRQRFESLMRGNIAVSWIVVLLFLVLLMSWHFLVGNDRYGVCACLFCMAIVPALTKVHVDNRVLQWLGNNAFAIYIMQRLPMNLYENLGLCADPYFFAILSIPSALLVAWGYEQIIHHVVNRFLGK